MSIQNQILKFLNTERYNGNSVVTNEQIENALGLDKNQVIQAKYQLIKKEEIIKVGDKECSLLKVMSPRKLNGRRCKHLSELRNRPFCTVRKVILQEQYLNWTCGVLQCTVFEPEPHIEYRNVCKNRCP